MSSTEIARPFGQSAWAAPYRSITRLNIGSSAVGPMSLGELAALAGRDVAEAFPDDLRFDYGDPGGSAEIREMIVEDMPGLAPDHVAVTSGAGDALATIAILTCRPGSHVVIEVPAHESLLATVDRVGCRVTLVQAPVDPHGLAAHIRPDTTAVFLSSPHNPTGQVLGAAALELLAGRLARVGALLVVDEVFRGVPLGIATPPPPVAAIAPNGVSVNSLSKVFGLPGIRIGWIAGPPLTIDDVRDFQRYTSKCPPLISEIVGKLALQCREELLCRARALAYDTYAELMAVCEGYPGVRLSLPDGGTAVFPELDVPDVDRWCVDVVEKHGLLIAPGNACFGIPGHIRINLGLAPAVRAEAFPVLAAALARTPSLSGPLLA